jgi:hypothetical protein
VSAAHEHALVASALAALATAAVFRRSPGAALAVVLAALIASNSSLLWLKSPFLTARWAALLVLAALLLPTLRRASRGELRALALLAVVPAVGLLSAAWSVDARLTVERAATFAALLWVVAAYAMRWRREPDDLAAFVDSTAVLAGLVLAASVVEGLVSSRGMLAHQFRGVFENPNGLGLFLALTYPFAAAALERRGQVALELAYLGACAAAATEARARNGLVVLVLTAVGLALAQRRLRWAAGVTVGIAAVVAATLALGSGTLSSGGTPAAGPAPTAPAAPAKPAHPAPAPAPAAPAAGGESRLARLTGARNEAWSAAVRLLKRKPLLGYGFGTGDRLFARYRVSFVNFEGADPADAYLRTALELGVVGLLVVLPLLGAGVLAVRLLVAGTDPDAVACALVLLGGLAAAVLESIFTTAGAPWAPLLWVSAGACVARARAVV